MIDIDVVCIVGESRNLKGNVVFHQNNYGRGSGHKVVYIGHEFKQGVFWYHDSFKKPVSKF